MQRAAGAAVATRTFTYTGAGQTHAVPADANRSHRDRGRRNLQQRRIEEAGMTASDLSYAFVNTEPMQRQRLKML